MSAIDNNSANPRSITPRPTPHPGWPSSRQLQQVGQFRYPRSVADLVVGVIGRGPRAVWDQKRSPAAAGTWLGSSFYSLARSGRSRLLRAAWRPCSRGPSRRLRAPVLRRGRWRVVGRCDQSTVLSRVVAPFDRSSACCLHLAIMVLDLGPRPWSAHRATSGLRREN
jgi:hypothetical protein